ncbi:MAG: putative lipid II flippase FtsW [candidate division Zixibacteria bacterium]
MKRRRTPNQLDESLFVAYLLTVVIGLVMVYSSSSIVAASRHGSQLFFIRQQLVWASLSVAVLYLLSRIDLKRLVVYSVPALLVSIVMLGTVFFFPPRNGSFRWIVLAGFSIQPSELFRFLMVMYLAMALSKPGRDISQWRTLLIPHAPLIGIGLLLIGAERDLGSVIVIVGTVVGIFFLAGARIKHLAAFALPTVSLGSFVVFVLGYKIDRITDYMSAFVDPLKGSYQVRQAILSLGSGGLVGTGLGEGRQKLGFLPYPHTDFILASAGEEIGLLGLLVLLGLLGFMLFRGFRIAARQPDRFGYLMAAGMTWMLFVNIAINIGVVTALLPVTGLPLPFISYGGSSLLCCSAAIGILLNLSRRSVR